MKYSLKLLFLALYGNVLCVKPHIMTTEVVMEPSQTWKTSRTEIVRLIERLKVFIRKEFRLAIAEEEQRRAQNANYSYDSLSPLAPNFTNPTAELRFAQKKTDNLEMPNIDDIFSNVNNSDVGNEESNINNAGLFLDSLQPKAERELASQILNLLQKDKNDKKLFQEENDVNYAKEHIVPLDLRLTGGIETNEEKPLLELKKPLQDGPI